MQRTVKPDIEAIKSAIEKRQLNVNEKMKFLQSKLDPSDVTACALTELAMPEIEGQSVSAAHGQKFKDGRKPGTGGPIRKAIAKLLASNPASKNPELWNAIKAKPPRGWTVNDAKYFAAIDPTIEGPNNEKDHMTYRRFCTVCGEERKKVRAKITG